MKFTEANSFDVNLGVKQDRGDNGAPYTKHASLFQISMGQKWKGLPKSEKDKWNMPATSKPVGAEPIDVVFRWVELAYYRGRVFVR